MQYTNNTHNDVMDRKPLQALNNPNRNMLIDDYMEHDEYKQASSMHIDNPSNENMDPSHMDNIPTEVKSAMNHDVNIHTMQAMQVMQSEFNHAQIENNNLYLRRQNKSNNSICVPSNRSMPALRIELCSSDNAALCSANSFIAHNDRALLSSASSIHSASVGNAYQCNSASISSETIENPSTSSRKVIRKKKSNSLFTKITNLMHRRSAEKMNQDADDTENQEMNQEDAVFTPSAGNTPRVNTVITPMTENTQYTKEAITQLIGKDTFVADYLEELLKEESSNNALSWYNSTASYNKEANKKLRKNAIDWICRIGIDWDLQRSTIYLAIYYFDKLCSSKEVNIYHLQMVAASCLLIAIKFNEREEKVPSLNKLSRACHKQYTPSSFKSMEVKLLNLLGFKLKTVLAVDFVSYYINNGCIFEDDKLENHHDLHLNAQSNVYLQKFAVFFLDISCQNYAFWNYLPSVLAFAVIAASRRALKIEPYFNKQLIAKCKYHPAEILECFESLWTEYRVKFPNDAKRAEILQPHSLSSYVMELD